MPPRSMRGEVENGRGDVGRSRSTSPSPQAGQVGPVPTMLTLEPDDLSAGTDPSAQSPADSRKLAPAEGFHSNSKRDIH
eukprot:3619318-Prorocentrum_lima.AAC.1